MLTPKSRKLKYSDVTPRRLYLGRRNFLLGLLAATASAGCGENPKTCLPNPAGVPLGRN